MVRTICLYCPLITKGCMILQGFLYSVHTSQGNACLSLKWEDHSAGISKSHIWVAQQGGSWQTVACSTRELQGFCNYRKDHRCTQKPVYCIHCAFEMMKRSSDFKSNFVKISNLNMSYCSIYTTRYLFSILLHYNPNIFFFCGILIYSKTKVQNMKLK